MNMKYYISAILITIIFSYVRCFSMEKYTIINENDIIHYYKNGKIQEIKNCSLTELKKKVIDCLIFSDDMYWKLLTKNMLESQKISGCIEVIFEKNIKIKIGALRNNQLLEISKIFLPLKQFKNKGYLEIYYGNPNYKEYNIVINKDNNLKESVLNLFNECLF